MLDDIQTPVDIIACGSFKNDHCLSIAVSFLPFSYSFEITFQRLRPLLADLAQLISQWHTVLLYVILYICQKQLTTEYVADICCILPDGDMGYNYIPLHQPRNCIVYYSQLQRLIDIS